MLNKKTFSAILIIASLTAFLSLPTYYQTKVLGIKVPVPSVKAVQKPIVKTLTIQMRMESVIMFGLKIPRVFPTN